VRYGSIGGLEYEVPQSRLYCLCINVALFSTALQCICRVIRRSSMTMKAHTYYIIFGRPPIGGSFPPSPLAAPLPTAAVERRCTERIWMSENVHSDATDRVERSQQVERLRRRKPEDALVAGHDHKRLQRTNRKLSFRRGTARCVVSVEILPTNSTETTCTTSPEPSISCR